MLKQSFSDVEHDIGQEQSEVSTASDRFFVMQSQDQTKPIHKLSPFVIDKAIKCTIRRLVGRQLTSHMNELGDRGLVEGIYTTR